MIVPPVAVVPDGNLLLAMTVGSLLGPATVLAMLVGVALGFAVVLSLVAHLRERAASRRPVADDRPAQQSSAFVGHSKLSA